MPDLMVPRLPKEFTADMPNLMSDMILRTVDAHSLRDQDLASAYDMLMALAPNPRNIPFRNSCQLIDRIVFENFLQLFASVRTARSQKPYWLFEALEQSEEQSASRVEKALSLRASADGFDAALYDSDWVALRDGAAPMYIGWSDKIRNVREIRYRAKGEPDGPLVQQNETDPDLEYDQVPYMVQVPQRSGFVYNVMDRVNFYMMAPDAKDIDSALGCGHREYYTANDLYEGIQTYKFDAEVVKQLIAQGPTGYDHKGEYMQSKQDVAGTTDRPDDRLGIGYWEIFTWFGKLPYWTKNGGLEVPEHLMNDEFLWIMCPGRQKVLRFSYSPFQMRPYCQFRMLREPNGQGGESVPSITSQYQEEGTAILRMGLDSAMFRTIPVLKRLVSNHERFGVQKLQPGGTVLCERGLQEVETLRWDHGQANETLAWLRDIRTRAKQNISGAGYGEIQEKVRKSAEIEAAVAAVSAKVSLIVRDLQDSGMVRAALLHLSHLTQYGSPDVQQVYSRSEGAITIEPEDWKRIYSIKPRGTADDANPELIIKKRTELMQMFRSSPLYQSKIAAGDYRAEYHLLRQWAAAFEEDIQSYFDEPPPPDYLQVVAQVMGQLYEMMTGIKGSAGQVTPQFMHNPAMQAVMSAMVKQQQQQQGGQSGPGGQGAPSGMNGQGVMALPQGQQAAVPMNGAGV